MKLMDSAEPTSCQTQEPNDLVRYQIRLEIVFYYEWIGGYGNQILMFSQMTQMVEITVN